MFTVVDYRAFTSLAGILGVEKDALRKQLGANPTNSSKAYVKYVTLCKHEAEKRKLDLRTFDRLLWGMNLYEGKNGLKELAARLKLPQP